MHIEYKLIHAVVAFWWWIYPFGFFAMTLTAHYFFSNAQYWKGALALIIIFNVILFLTWGLTQPVGEMYEGIGCFFIA